MLAGSVGPCPRVRTWTDELQQIIVEDGGTLADAATLLRRYASPLLLGFGAAPIACAMSSDSRRFAASAYALYDGLQRAIELTPRQEVAPPTRWPLTGACSLSSEDPAWQVLQGAGVGIGTWFVTNTPSYAYAAGPTEERGEAGGQPTNEKVEEARARRVALAFASPDYVVFKSKRPIASGQRRSLVPTESLLDGRRRFALPPLSTVTVDAIMPLEACCRSCNVITEGEASARVFYVTVDYKEW